MKNYGKTEADCTLKIKKLIRNFEAHFIGKLRNVRLDLFPKFLIKKLSVAPSAWVVYLVLK